MVVNYGNLNYDNNRASPTENPWTQPYSRSMTPTPRRASKSRDLQLSLASLLAFLSWGGLMAFFAVIPVLYLRKFPLTWPMIVGGACVVAILFILYYLLAAQLRCQVCGGPVFGGGEGHRKHPNATKFLGISYSRKVAWEILTSSGFHCMHCQTFCRSRRRVAAAGPATAETSLPPGGNVFQPGDAAGPTAGPGSSPLFGTLFQDAAQNGSAPSPEPKPLAHPERQPWAHHAQVAPFNQTAAMNPAPQAQPSVFPPPFPAMQASPQMPTMRPAPAGAGQMPQGAPSPFQMMTPPHAQMQSAPAPQMPQMPQLPPVQNVGPPRLPQGPTAQNPAPLPAMPPNFPQAQQPAIPAQPFPGMPSTLPQMPAQPQAYAPSAPPQMSPTAPVLPQQMPAPQRPVQAAPSMPALPPSPPIMPLPAAPPQNVQPQAPASLNSLPAMAPPQPAPEPKPVVTAPPSQPQINSQQVVAQVTKLIEETRQSMDALFGKMLNQLQVTLQQNQTSAPANALPQAAPSAPQATAPISTPPAPAPVNPQTAAAMNAVLARAFAQSQRSQEAQLPPLGTESAHHEQRATTPPQSPFSLVTQPNPEPRHAPVLPFPPMQPAKANGSLPQPPTAGSPFAALAETHPGKVAQSPFAGMPQMPKFPSAAEADADSPLPPAPFTFLSQQGDQYVPDPSKVNAPWPPTQAAPAMPWPPPGHVQ
jgi:hypothetical protein